MSLYSGTVTKDAAVSYLNKLLVDGEADYSWEVLQARGRLETNIMIAESGMVIYKFFGFCLLLVCSLLFFEFGFPLINVWMLFAIAFFGVIARAYGKLIHLLVAVIVISTLIGLWMAYVNMY